MNTFVQCLLLQSLRRLPVQQNLRFVMVEACVTVACRIGDGTDSGDGALACGLLLPFRRGRHLRPLGLSLYLCQRLTLGGGWQSADAEAGAKQGLDPGLRSRSRVPCLPV